MPALHDKTPPFVSHASNFEDVIVTRVFPGDSGFYVDVGGNDPVWGSVTWQLYQRGWSGIVVEPIERLYKNFLSQRPRDISLCIALADTEGTQSLYVFEKRLGLSTTVAAIAEQHKRDFGEEPSKITVPLRTLASLLDQYAPGRPIDLLKIDAEGAEAAVLRGAAFHRHRPKLIIIEAMEPMRQEDASTEASTILEENDYILGLEDGLNKFFVASEHKELLSKLRYPANIFDHFVPYGESLPPDVRSKAVRRLRRLRIVGAALAVSLIFNLVLLVFVFR